MLRKNFTFFLFALLAFSGSGCESAPPQLPYPELCGVPERLALGAAVDAYVIVYSGLLSPSGLVRGISVGVAFLGVRGGF